MTQDKCIINVNGSDIEARPGQMLMEVTDVAGIYIPRFCYHSKLSVAANCRMCLVEVENSPKPVPACATPVSSGMKVHTKSKKAISAQKATMEFLLINHPLDCPICDQGGECELQDLAMGFGRDISRYTERKRVVKDKNIGPLISTDMTRCIHCTRCVRFTDEIAGLQELGTIGRSDRMEISTYIERAVSHELSGNVIDLCPVGALNSKPFRFAARAWEMSQQPVVAGHDCLGSRLYAHVLNGRVKRVVPQPCEPINETWISDRDRFSYEGIYSADRLRQPMLRDESGWHATGWEQALDAVAERLQALDEPSAQTALGALVSPSATVEEGYLLTRLMNHLGSANVDHRLRRRDFRHQETDPAFPWLGMEVADVECLEQVLVVGSNLRKEVPLLAHRVRKAAVRGAGVHFVNPGRFPHLFPVGEYFVGTPAEYWHDLELLVRAASGDSGANKRHRQLVGRIRAAGESAIFLGQISLRHPRLAEIEFLASELARLTGSALGYIAEGANAAGLALAGVLPHRSHAGGPRAVPGATTEDMVASPPRRLVLFGIEPELDCAGGERLLDGAARFTVAFSPFMSASLRRAADIVLPIGTFMETSGTYVNAEGRWQSFGAAARPEGEARPAWKVLRVLGNRLGLPDCEYASSEAIRDEVRALIGEVSAGRPAFSEGPGVRKSGPSVTMADLDVPMYQIDALVRRAAALQQTDDARAAIPGADDRRRA
jgi:NADH-quinone oxidoreductase subunit G